MKKFLSVILLAMFVVASVISCDTECNSSVTESEKKTNPPPKGASVATINVTVNVSDVTMDEIFQTQFSYGTGTYSEGKPFDSTLKFNKAKVTITKNDEHSGTVKFKVEDKNLVDDFFHFFYLKFVDNGSNTVGCMEKVYQDDTIFDNKTVKDLTLTVDGLYGEITVDLK